MKLRPLNDDLRQKIEAKLKTATDTMERGKASAKGIVDNLNHNNLAHLSLSFFQSYGEYKAWEELHIRSKVEQTIEGFVFQIALMGAKDTDDQWSGRSNDFRRMAEDGKKAVLREVLELISE